MDFISPVKFRRVSLQKISDDLRYLDVKISNNLFRLVDRISQNCIQKLSKFYTPRRRADRKFTAWKVTSSLKFCASLTAFGKIKKILATFFENFGVIFLKFALISINFLRSLEKRSANFQDFHLYCLKYKFLLRNEYNLFLVHGITRVIP